MCLFYLYHCSVCVSTCHSPVPFPHADLLLWGCPSHPPVTIVICYRLQLGSRKMPRLPQLLKASGRAIKVYKKREMVVFLVAAWFLEGRNGELTPSLKIITQLMLVIAPSPVALFNFLRSNPLSLGVTGDASECPAAPVLTKLGGVSLPSHFLSGQSRSIYYELESSS